MGGRSLEMGSPQPRRGRRRAPRPGLTGWKKELPVLVTLVVLCLAAAAGAVVFGVRDARSDALCDGIDSINRGEQRVCRPPRTGDVRLSRSWPNLTAYRYAAAALPDTVPHTAHWAQNTSLYPRECAALDFALAAGGRVNYTYRAEDGTTPLGATPDAPTPDGVTAPLLSSTVNSTPGGDDPVSTLYGTAPPPAYA